MHYKINKSLFNLPKEISAWDYANANRKAIKAILAIILAGEINLTQEGYDKLDDELKMLFIAKED